MTHMEGKIYFELSSLRQAEILACREEYIKNFIMRWKGVSPHIEAEDVARALSTLERAGPMDLGDWVYAASLNEAARRVGHLRRVEGD